MIGILIVHHNRLIMINWVIHLCFWWIRFCPWILFACTNIEHNTIIIGFYYSEFWAPHQIPSNDKHFFFIKLFFLTVTSSHYEWLLLYSFYRYGIVIGFCMIFLIVWMRKMSGNWKKIRSKFRVSLLPFHFNFSFSRYYTI